MCDIIKARYKVYPTLPAYIRTVYSRKVIRTIANLNCMIFILSQNVPTVYYCPALYIKVQYMHVYIYS